MPPSPSTTIALEYHGAERFAAAARLGAAAIAAPAPAIMVRRSTCILRSPLVPGASICESNGDDNGLCPHHNTGAHGGGRRSGAAPEEPRRVHWPAVGARESARVRACCEEPRGAARPCAAPRAAWPRQDDARRNPGPRNGRRI